jgi:hypothetical protein
MCLVWIFYTKWKYTISLNFQRRGTCTFLVYSVISMTEPRIVCIVVVLHKLCHIFTMTEAALRTHVSSLCWRNQFCPTMTKMVILDTLKFIFHMYSAFSIYLLYHIIFFSVYVSKVCGITVRHNCYFICSRNKGLVPETLLTQPPIFDTPKFHSWLKGSFLYTG